MSECFSEVSKWLKSKWVSVPADNAWLRSCVDYYKSEKGDWGLADLREFVYDQWLLADLREVGAGCLPPDSLVAPKLTLPSRYALQANYAVDISRPFYKQLADLRRPGAADNQEVDSSERQTSLPAVKRSLKIELTDGVSTVTGFEEEPVPRLVEPLPPGIKILIVGPVDCRKGVLLLKAHNVQVLGGEVDTLLIPNAVENILARTLGVEENEDPYKTLAVKTNLEGEDEDDEALAMVASQIETQVNSVATTAPVSLDIESDEDEFAMMAAVTASIAEQSSQRPVVQRMEVNCGPQKSLARDNSTAKPIAHAKPTTVNAVPNNLKKKPPVQKQKQTTILGFLSQSENEPATLRDRLQESYGSKMNSTKPGFSDNKQQAARSGVVQSSVANNFGDYKPNCNYKSNDELPRPPLRPDQMVVDYLAEEEEEALFASALDAELRSQQPPKVTAAEPPPSFEPVFFPPKKFPAVTTVTASVVRLPQKLSMRDDKWCLSAIISARDVELEVDFSSEALDKIFGITAAEIKARKNEVRLNPGVKEKINETLKSSQMRIKNLNSRMVIEFSSFIAKPVILDILDT